MKPIIPILCICILVSGCATLSTEKSKGEKVKKEIYNAANEMQSYYTYQYNQYDKEKRQHFSPSGKLLRYFLYTYDKDGKRLEKQEFDVADKLVSITAYEYN